MELNRGNAQINPGETVSRKTMKSLGMYKRMLKLLRIRITGDDDDVE